MRRSFKVVVGVVAVAFVILALTSVTLILLKEQPGPPGQKIPWLFSCGPPTARYDLPINKTGASLYADDLIKNYNNQVNSREGQAGNFQSVSHYFPLYHAVGQTFNVTVARDNESRTDDLIEFFFVLTPGTTPNVNVVTTETASELRPVTTACPNEPVQLAYDITSTPYWTILSDVSTNSPLGVTYFQMIWVTNMSSVFSDPLGAATAAHTIYYNGHDAYLQSLGTPFPSWSWLENLLTGLWGVFIAASAVFGTWVSYLSYRDRRAGQHAVIRRPREAKSHGKGDDMQKQEKKGEEKEYKAAQPTPAPTAQTDPIRRQRDRIDHLKTLKNGNNEFKAWRDQTERILADRYGKGSQEFEQFWNIYHGPYFISTGRSEVEWQKDYLDDLDRAMLHLNSLIEDSGSTAQTKAAAPDVAEAPARTCPKCGSKDVEFIPGDSGSTTHADLGFVGYERSSSKPVAYYVCRNCGHTFKP